MKCQIPEISWHNRDPVLSVDFQPKGESSDKVLRLASGGSDCHVLIWFVVYDEGVVRLDLAADLQRHQRAVNCVRWSPSGEYLASCDDESVIFIWRQKPETEIANICDEVSEADKEVWLIHKILRGHVEDVYDLSWSQNSEFLLSGSVDNTAIVWEVQKGNKTLIRDHKGFVQGVSWDPLNKYLATISTDRYFRLFDVQTKKIVQRNNKSILPVSASSSLHNKNVRLFHDDTLQTFFRRLCFSPEGTLIVVPSGVADDEGCSAKPINMTYIYTRYSLKGPAVALPSPDQFTVAVRFCPLLFKLRASKSDPIIPLPYRMIFAIATKCSVYLYDTQQKLPFGLISNIHYTRLTDLAWSNDGNTLLVSSTDGYCSIVQFTDGELGKLYEEQSIQDIINSNTAKEEPKKKKKVKRAKKEEKEKSPSTEEKENDEKMDVDQVMSEISLPNLPISIKEKIPVDKIIKSSELFSPEKQVGSPATPIQVRKYPRNMEELDVSPPKNENISLPDAITPKASSFFSSKTPTRIEVRRQPNVMHSRQTLSQATGPAHNEDTELKAVIGSPMDRKIPGDSTTPKNLRRVELTTISTPKSKKKLL